MLSHFSCVQLFATIWTVARQASLSMGFYRQKYRSELPFPSPGDLPDPGIETESPVAPTFQGDSLPLSHGESVCSLWEDPQGSLPPTIYTLCNTLSLTICWTYCILLRNRIWQEGWEANVLIFFNFNFWLQYLACGILVPQKGVEHTASSLHWEHGVLTTWTAREVPKSQFW